MLITVKKIYAETLWPGESGPMWDYDYTSIGVDNQETRVIFAAPNSSMMYSAENEKGEHFGFQRRGFWGL